MYLNGECTEEEILQKFLNNFETVGIQDSVVIEINHLLFYPKFFIIL